MVSYVRGRTRKLSNEEIVAAYLAGETSAEVAYRANTDASTVLYLVKRAGHPTRPRGPAVRTKVLPLPDDEICRLYRSGLSGPVIGQRCNVSTSTIYQILRRCDVKLRPSGSALRAASARARKAREAGGR